MRVSFVKAVATSACAAAVFLIPAASAGAVTTTPSVQAPTQAQIFDQFVQRLSFAQAQTVDAGFDRFEALRPSLAEGRFRALDDALDLRVDVRR
jgi:hypothetical protein